ncbi:response regulator [Magnetococcales bacterium HHB-1]
MEKFLGHKKNSEKKLFPSNSPADNNINKDKKINTKKTSLLLVDDEAGILFMLKKALKRPSFSIYTASNGIEAVRTLESTSIDILITDLRMPRLSGLELLERANRLRPDLQSIVISGHGDITDAIEAMKRGVMGYVMKPIHFQELEIHIQRCLEKNRTLDKLRDARNQAMQAASVKSEFLAVMSHEIRTPLNAIIGMTDLILNTASLPENQRDNLKIVQESSHTLLELINGILDLSKIEAGQMVLENVPFDLWGQVEKTCETLAVKAHQKGLELYCQIDTNLPHTLNGDPFRLKQIIINLVNNAIKFTDQGEVLVRVSSPEIKPDNQTVPIQFSVIDTGIGIPKERKQQIFESFTQADTSTTRKYGGTGLGLNICAQLVQMMGGEILVESTVAQGSDFSFTVPLEISQRTSFKSPHDLRTQSLNAYNKLTDIRILVIDPHDTCRTILKGLLASFNTHTKLVKTLEQAEQILNQAAQNNQPFDITLLDRTLLNQNKTALHQHPGCRTLPIYMITAIDHISYGTSIKKPIRRFKLLNRINQHLGRKTTSHPKKQKRKRPPTTRHLNILLVEDLINNQKLATAILKREGHTITIANHGKEALEKIKQHDFDIILMDLQMPKMDGFEATRQIRQYMPDYMSQASYPPIIAVTAHTMASERQACLDAGMNNHLRKPYTAKDMLSIIERYSWKRPPKPPPEPIEMLDTKDIPPTELQKNILYFQNEVSPHLIQLKKAFKQKTVRTILTEISWLRETAEEIGAFAITTHTIRLAGKVEMEEWENAKKILINLENIVQQTLDYLQKQQEPAS